MSLHAVKCSGCGDLVEMDIEDAAWEIVNRVATPLVNRFACDKCVEKMEETKQMTEAQEFIDRIQARMLELADHWNQICPPIYLTVDPDKINPEAREAFTQATHWHYSPTGLVLYGKTGMCKTRAAWVILHRIYMDGKSVMAFTANEFNLKCSAECMRSETFGAWVSKLKWVDLLLFDDLGKRKLSEVAEAQLIDVIDHRCKYLKPTIITTESTHNPVSEVNMDAFSRRLGEYFLPIHFGGS